MRGSDRDSTPISVAHVSAVTVVWRLKAGPRSANGSSIDGSVLKNSTPAEKSLIERPVFGSRRMPPGTDALMKMPSGPSSESAKRIVRPPMPGNSKPPCTPMKNTRSRTGVTVSSALIMFRF